MGNRLYSVTKQHRPTVLLYTTLKASKSVESVCVCVCVCARMYVCIRETRERQKTSQLDAEESLFESLMIFALGKR